MNVLEGDLNSTIAAAVNARIEAAVMEALSGDEVMGRYIASALSQKVEVDRYDRKKDRTFLSHVVEQAIQEATRAAVLRFVADERDLIETEVRKGLRKQIPAVAEQLVNGLRGSAYAVSVHVRGDE